MSQANQPAAAPTPEFYQALVNRLNEPRAQSIKSIPCSTYKSGEDFSLWVTTFTDTVRAAHNLTATDNRLNALCLNWISTKLEVGPTRSVYDNLSDATKRDWPALKQALSDGFKDESEEIRFLNNDDAWQRGDMSLIDYKNGLLHRMSKYQPDLRTVQGEWERTAVRRFRAGLNDPVLEAHILMSCQGAANHTLDRAYTVALNYENTLQTITQKGGNKVTPPNMASMLNIPQMATLSLDPPQFSALTPLQEKTNERLSALETAAKKHELDVSELKAGLSEVKDGLKSIKEEIAQTRINQSFQRPVYQRPVRPLYPVSRMPLGPSSRSYYQQGSQGMRPRTVAGLTGGPGYVTTQPQSQSQTYTLPQRQAAHTQSPSTQIGASQASPLAFPQRPPGPSLSALDEPKQRDDEHPQFANPNLQYGSHDTGYGWTNVDFDDAQAYGYDLAPEGMYVFNDLPF